MFHVEDHHGGETVVDGAAADDDDEDHGSDGDGRGVVSRGGGGGVRDVSHSVHGGVRHDHGPGDDASQGGDVQECDKVCIR